MWSLLFGNEVNFLISEPLLGVSCVSWAQFCWKFQLVFHNSYDRNPSLQYLKWIHVRFRTDFYPRRDKNKICPKICWDSAPYHDWSWSLPFWYGSELLRDVLDFAWEDTIILRVGNLLNRGEFPIRKTIFSPQRKGLHGITYIDFFVAGFLW